MSYSNHSPVRKSSISNGASKTFVLCFGVLAMVFLLNYLVLAWIEPSQSPPQGNVPAPLNVGNVGKSKSGGLILNTVGAATGLVVDKGNVGIGITEPGVKLDVNGKIRMRSSTTSTDPGSTVVTKDYLEGYIGFGDEILLSPHTPSHYACSADQAGRVYFDSYFNELKVCKCKDDTKPCTSGYIWEAIASNNYKARKTVTRYNGNLGGVDGANAKCQAEFGAGLVFASAGITAAQYDERFHECSRGVAFFNGWPNCKNWTYSGPQQIINCTQNDCGYNTHSGSCLSAGLGNTCEGLYSLLCVKQ